MFTVKARTWKSYISMLLPVVLSAIPRLVPMPLCCRGDEISSTPLYVIAGECVFDFSLRLSSEQESNQFESGVESSKLKKRVNLNI